MESVRINEQLKLSLQQAQLETKALRQQLDDQKSQAAEQIRELQSKHWQEASQNTLNMHKLLDKNERLAQELQHTRRQFRSFLQVVL